MCGGRGETWTEPCVGCRGTGDWPLRVPVRTAVPPRVADAQRFRFRGIAPDTFTDSVDVVVGGRMGADGTFQATELLAKCASRYENAPSADKYKQTPGYQAGKRA